MPRCLLVFEPPDGGVAENVLRLAVGLGSHGIEVWVAGPEQAIIHPELSAAGIPFARLPFERGYGHPLRDLRALRRLVAIVRRGDFALIHAHSAKAGVLARIAALATGTTSIYSPHCFPFVGPWGPPRRLFSLAVERTLGARTDAIVCVAEQERRLAIELHVGRPERLHVVHNGSEPCASGLEGDPRLDELARQGPLAASVAVLRPQKSIHTFVAAAPSILERVPSAQLAVVGDGELRDQLRAQAEGLGVGDRVHFLDYRPPAARQLASLDVFVLPSAWEAFPISVLEAMACGVPQVATDVGGTSEALVDGVTGRLCPPEDPAALADAVVALLRDGELRARMAAAARERHRELFTIERMLARTAEVYRHVLGAPGDRSPVPRLMRTV